MTYILYLRLKQNTRFKTIARFNDKESAWAVFQRVLEKERPDVVEVYREAFAKDGYARAECFHSEPSYYYDKWVLCEEGENPDRWG